MDPVDFSERVSAGLSRLRDNFGKVITFLIPVLICGFTLGRWWEQTSRESPATTSPTIEATSLLLIHKSEECGRLKERKEALSGQHTQAIDLRKEERNEREAARRAQAQPGEETRRFQQEKLAHLTENQNRQREKTITGEDLRPPARTSEDHHPEPPPPEVKSEQPKRQDGQSQAIQPASRPANSGHVVRYRCPKRCTKIDLHPDYATRIEQNLDFLRVPLRRIDYQRPDGWWRTTVVYGPSPDWQERMFSSEDAALAALHELRTSGFQAESLKE
jgi:hypothetical protein